jgi:hypothetical protein
MVVTSVLAATAAVEMAVASVTADTASVKPTASVSVALEKEAVVTAGVASVEAGLVTSDTDEARIEDGAVASLLARFVLPDT